MFLLTDMFLTRKAKNFFKGQNVDRTKKKLVGTGSKTKTKNKNLKFCFSKQKGSLNFDLSLLVLRNSQGDIR